MVAKVRSTSGIAMKMYGVSETLRNVRVLYEHAANQGLVKEAHEMVEELEAATPVDTGFARGEWKVGREIVFDPKDLVLQGSVIGAIEPGRVTIRNNAPYIEALNAGHSEQAPEHFIERVVLAHGNPDGIIVTTIPET
jgi:hypothetical protein